ncbi:unnamed protein product [Ilex paraguariensis]|uniref:1-phosphatidylinositol-3-phosphate 5-kinase n=1 Tax=Ilex paraguariensis TaxID=185542 RepID=A0ABC8UIV4_9AQUA
MDKQETGNSGKLHGGDPVGSCQESSMQNGSSPHATPSISPTASLISSDSCVSSCSDFSVDANSHGRGYQEEGNSNGSQVGPNFGLKRHPQDMRLPIHVSKIHRSSTVVKSNLEESNNLNARCNGGDVKYNGIGDDEETRNNGVERASSASDEETGFSSYNDETDSRFWLPPEPEDQEDDIEDSVANYDDDDDECGDGMNWGKPSSFSSFGEEGSGNYRFKEGKQKAMNEVMNGKFKDLVGQLLKTVGLASTGKDGEPWVDIVTSLSWEAALFVKPDASEGKAMDPDGYVKVKCIATGTRSQSQLIKGLVFKKHAAHKHMPTNYRNPKLLLIQGSLGLSSSRLYSFDSMNEEKDSLKSLIEMIEMCQPNVVLVEKTVSRDLQESILSKGMTLVFDMKLHRLERVARCTGSTILSSDTLIGQKLRQCDSFHFEKFVEEHAAPGDGGKRPSKTLMFLEGCPTRLGCTILLMGTHSDELKKVKCVVQCAVVMAYHLILETSFRLDQTMMFSTIPLTVEANLSLTDKQSPSGGSGGTIVSCFEVPSGESDSSFSIDVPISNGVHEDDSPDLNSGLEGNSSLSFEPYNPVILSGLSYLSASLKKVMGDNFPLFSTSRQCMSACFDFDERYPNGQIQTDVHVSSSPDTIDHGDMEVKGRPDEERALDNEQPLLSSTGCEAPLETHKSGGNNEDQVQSKDDISTVLDSASILVLMSSRNCTTGNMCEHSHFSHIKFYRNFDVPLGKFLRDNLLNQVNRTLLWHLKCYVSLLSCTVDLLCVEGDNVAVSAHTPVELLKEPSVPMLKDVICIC